MQKQLFGVSIFVLCFSNLVFGQSSASKYLIKGIVRDQTSRVVPGLSLTAKKNEENSFGFTDINGEFYIDLSPGDHALTASELQEGSFKAFIRIVGVGPNPEYVEFLIDSSTLCKQQPEKYNYPGVLKSSTPPTPPAARAVRAVGTVVVVTRIGLDGKVISAKAISGHPLLRKASEIAAQKFEFDTSEIKEEIELPLRFIFIDSSGPAKETPRYSCPYRIVINREPVVLDVTGTH
mgnify:CR=1 FL=1